MTRAVVGPLATSSEGKVTWPLFAASVSFSNKSTSSFSKKFKNSWASYTHQKRNNVIIYEDLFYFNNTTTLTEISLKTHQSRSKGLNDESKHVLRVNKEKLDNYKNQSCNTKTQHAANQLSSTTNTRLLKIKFGNQQAWFNRKNKYCLHTGISNCSTKEKRVPGAYSCGKAHSASSTSGQNALEQ